MSTIAIIGATGPQGKGLGYRFARAGHDVVLGSRRESRAVEAADELTARLTTDSVGSVNVAENTRAIEVADLVLLAVPYEGHDELVAHLAPYLAGKVVISCVNPLGFDKQGPYALDLGPSSAAEQAQRLLPNSAVIGAFHHLSAVTLTGRPSSSTTKTSWCVATTPRQRRRSSTWQPRSPESAVSTQAHSD